MFYSCANNDYTEIVEVKNIVQPSIFDRKDGKPDFKAMLSSFSNIDGIYTMTFHGNFDELIAYHHDQIMKYFASQEKLKQDTLHCSLFAYFDKANGAYFGRNFDNRDTELLVGLFIPDSGYTSIGFIPMIELKFDKSNPFDSTSEIHRQILLHSAAVTVDGINEMGVTISVASVGRETVNPDTSKPYKFLLHLIRNILDHARDVNSAIEIASRYNVFDNSKHHISHHILIADPNGNSAVLEWKNGRMHVIRNSTNWQIATNTKLYNASAEKLCSESRRYNNLHYRLVNAQDTLTWQQGMDALQSVEQTNKVYYFESGPLHVSTQWSALFNLKTKTVSVCVNREFNRVYRFKLHSKQYYQSLSNKLKD